VFSFATYIPHAQDNPKSNFCDKFDCAASSSPQPFVWYHLFAKKLAFAIPRRLSGCGGSAVYSCGTRRFLPQTRALARLAFGMILPWYDMGAIE
jgi:hypothetical protein